MTPRPWGWWTSHKLQILEDYLQAFATASSGKTERIYLDLFAGTDENVDRATRRPILGSVHRALAAQPAFTQVRLFEQGNRAKLLEAALTAEYPNRAGLSVSAGDCNVELAPTLRQMSTIRWAPTFAFVDQQAAEVHWQTLRQISEFRPKHLTKAEMWILFGTSFLPRGLRINQPQVDDAFALRTTALYGSEEWFPIIEARQAGQMTATETRFELSNLMRWRLEKVLGYKKSYTFTMRNTNGSELYDMIFVTDHDAGDRIMRSLYSKAESQHRAMQEAAYIQRQSQRDRDKREKAGLHTLFDIDETFESSIPVGTPPRGLAGQSFYHEPPQPPYGAILSEES